VSTNSGFKH